MKKHPARLLVALSLALLLLSPLPARRALTQEHDEGAEPRGLQPLFTDGSTPELRHARNLTWRYLEDHREEFGLDRKNHMKMLRAFVDELAMAHVHVRQTYGDVDVFGGELIVHWNKDGTLAGVTDSWVDGLQVETAPALTAEQAVAAAAASGRGCHDCFAVPPDVGLWVLRHGGADRLAYRVQLTRDESGGAPGLPVSFVDAHTGEIFWEYDNLQTATGSSLYSGDVSFNTFHVPGGNSYRLEDLTRKLGTYNYNNGTSAASSFTDADDHWDAPAQRAGVDAHYAMSAVWDYFSSAHGRVGMDGGGGPLFTTSTDGTTKLFTARVHYGSNYVNAFWNGSYLVFGDGDGDTSGPLVTVDIVGHEMTHALIQSTAGFNYAGESGALSESWADVFGAMAERHAKGEGGTTQAGHDIWKIGEECWTPRNGTGDALRYLDDPHEASNNGYTANDDPDHYGERYTGAADNGGVHVNAGIPSKAFHLLAQGGAHHLGGSMEGIGADNAARIWYKALTTYMTSGTDFAAARAATADAANVLFGPDSDEAFAVGRAWCLVGVGACTAPPVENDGPPPPPAAPPTQLQNGVTVEGLSGATGSEKRFYLSVPEGATNVSFRMSGGSGDADLYVKFGGAPTRTSFDCRPYMSGNNETCNMGTSAAGDWHVLVEGYSPYSGLSLTGSYTPPGTPPAQELIVNGGFTSNSSPWVLSHALYSATGGVTGGHVALGGSNNSTGTAYQQLTIPATSTSAFLTFYLKVSTLEATTFTKHDRLYVEVRDSRGALLATPVTYSNLNRGNSYLLRGGFDLGAYRGQTIRLQFRATNDASLPTTFRVDGVSVK